MKLDFQKRFKVENSIILPGKILGSCYLGNELIAIYGELSEIYIIQSNTCEQYCTLLSRLYPDWVTCATAIPVDDSVSVLLGVTAGGTLKVWRISSIIKDSVIFEEESKQIRECSHPIKVQIKLDFLVILTRKSLLVIDSSDFMTVGLYENRNRVTYPNGSYKSVIITK